MNRLARTGVRCSLAAAAVFALAPASVQAQKTFASGFEAGTYTIMDATEQRATDIRGCDSTTGYDWVEDLEADGREHKMNYCDDTDGANPSMLGAYIDEDPDDPNNKVFYTWQYDSEWQSGGWWSRVQTRMNNCRFGEAYLKMRVRFGSDMAVVNNEDWRIWCSLFSINPLNDDGYSLSIRLVRDTVLKWGVYRKNKVEGPTHYRTQKKVQYDTWHTMEFYAKAGDADNGRFWLAVDGERIIDEQARTSDAGDVWENMRFFKLYGSIVDVVTDPEKGNRECVKVWWDDFELWDSEPAATAVEAPRGLAEQAAVHGSHMHRGVQGQWYSLAGRVHAAGLPYAEGAGQTSHHSRLGRGVYIVRSVEGALYRHLRP
jgi:hypothetical protein